LRFYEVAAGGVFRAITPAYFGTRNWTTIPAGDYNGDGSDDVLFYRGDGLARFYEVDASGTFRALGAAFSPSRGFTQIESVEFTPGTAGVDLAWYHAGSDVLAATRYNTNGVVNLWAPQSTAGYGDDLTIATGVFAPAPIALETATQTNHFLTGYKGPDLTSDELTVPSVDPAGIAYHGPSNHLFIVDSEMNEPDLDEVWTDLGGKNVFEVSLNGSALHKSYALPGVSREQQEPTGIAYDSTDDVFYVTNDITKVLYRYRLTGGEFKLLDSVPAPKGADFEGVTVDASSGNIYVMDERGKAILVYTYDDGGGGFKLIRSMNLAVINPTASLPRTPEGIAFNGTNLFVVSERNLGIFEYTTAGVLVGRYTVKDFAPASAFGAPQHNLTKVKAPQGITFGPGSSPAFYLADGGVDNGTGAIVDGFPELERDGAIYEGRLP
jgi:hypothetical protein